MAHGAWRLAWARQQHIVTASRRLPRPIRRETSMTRSFAFVFPMASGHINPSLAIARRLVQEGHEVHYLCREQMRDAIEDTGASFHSDIQEQAELYQSRDPSSYGMYGPVTALMEEYGLKASLTEGRLIIRELVVELMLPGTLRWLRRIRADAMLCDPLTNLEAPLAAKVHGIPCASLLTTAGPGSMSHFLNNIMANVDTTPSHLLAQRRNFRPVVECIDRLRETYGLELHLEDFLQPVGLMRSCLASTVTLVTTAEFLADPMSAELEEAYCGHRFIYLGPLLDQPGAKRCGGHKFDSGACAGHGDHSGHGSHDSHGSHGSNSDAEAVRLAREAKAAGRPLVLASLGTIITGDHSDYGWNAKPALNGEKKGLNGKELCQAAWQGVFDAFGAFGDSGVSTPFILIALGPQPDALENMKVPDNAFCSPSLPQVDLLRLGVEVFLTHGGQNSFMEALSVGTPMVVCPGFGDQPINAAKAEALHIGQKLDRPMRDGEAEAYRRAAAAALRQVVEDPSFKAKAEKCADSLNVGGVDLATKVLLSLTTTPTPLQKRMAGA